MISLEKERSSELTRLFNRSDFTPSEARLLRNFVDKVQRLDGCTCNMIRVERDQLANVLRGLRNGRQGERMYKIAVEQ